MKTIHAPHALRALLATMKSAKEQGIHMAVWDRDIKAIEDAIATIEAIRAVSTWRTQMSYDSKCYELASAFLQDWPTKNTEENRDKLAQHIQTEIESEIEFVLEPVAARCELCGEPMPSGEEMFKYHGFSGPCPKSPLQRSPQETAGD